MPVAPPIFLLSCERSGSTLLRYLLDTHPCIGAPGELALGQLCSHVQLVVERTSPPGTPAATIRQMTASLVESLMTDYLERVGKTRWCDKSPSNLSHLDTLSALFPSARFVCLYRACLDTVQSCIEANRYGAMREHRPYVAKHPGNLPLAMTENWLDKTGALLAFEASHQAQCVRIRYEDLVECPPRELARVLKFLELPVVADLHLTALRHRHFEGGGDPKARFECDVHTRSVGKGRVIPLTFLPIQAIRQINLLSEQLSYSAIPTTPIGPHRAGHVPA